MEKYSYSLNFMGWGSLNHGIIFDGNDISTTRVQQEQFTYFCHSEQFH